VPGVSLLVQFISYLKKVPTRSSSPCESVEIGRQKVVKTQPVVSENQTRASTAETPVTSLSLT
jgi:hypothetical protein